MISIIMVYLKIIIQESHGTNYPVFNSFANFV